MDDLDICKAVYTFYLCRHAFNCSLIHVKISWPLASRVLNSPFWTPLRTRMQMHHASTRCTGGPGGPRLGGAAERRGHRTRAEPARCSEHGGSAVPGGLHWVCTGVAPGSAHRALRPHRASGVCTGFCTGFCIGVCSGRRIGRRIGRRHVVLAEELQDLTDHFGAHVPARVVLRGEAEGSG